MSKLKLPIIIVIVLAAAGAGLFASGMVGGKSGPTKKHVIEPIALAEPFNVNLADTLRQAIGFTPAKISERYERNSRLKNAEQRIMDERSALMAAYTTPLRRGEDVPQRVLDKIEAFNAENPDYPVTAKSLKASLSGRIRASAAMDGGVYLNPKLSPRLRGMAPPPIY